MKLRSVVGLAALAALAACSAPTVPVTSGPASDTPDSAATSATSGPAAGAEVDAAQLLSTLSAAMVKVTSFTMEMTLTSEVGGKPASGTITAVTDQSDSAHPRMHYSLDLGGTTMDMILVDGVTYLKMAGLGDKYIKLTNDQLKQLGGGTPGLTANTGLEQAKGSVRRAVFIGTDEVDGLQARQYRLTLDAAAFKKVGGLGEFGVNLTADTFDYDLWMDTAGLMRKMSIALPSEDSPFQLTATFAGYGEPVDIQAPDPSQVTTMPG